MTADNAKRGLLFDDFPGPVIVIFTDMMVVSCVILCICSSRLVDLTFSLTCFSLQKQNRNRKNKDFRINEIFFKFIYHPYDSCMVYQFCRYE